MGFITLEVPAPAMQCLDLDRLNETVLAERERLAAAAPFPHVVLDDLLYPDVADAVVREFDAARDGWQFFQHFNEKKIALNDPSRMGPASRAVIADLQSDAFVRALDRLVGIEGLLADPELDGGGLQQTLPGGFLNVHTDFLAHSKRRTWSRQVNLLLFLNKEWEESHRGWLEFWDPRVTRCVRRIEPIFNRCVVFRTSATSFHGVPAGVACPEGDSRKSIALYYFRDEGKTCPLRPTRYVPLPGDSALRRALIRADRWLIAGYSFMKRYTPLRDAMASKILKHL